MASNGSESLTLVDKFNGENFSLWKFKMEMVLASKELWDIVDGSEEAPPSTADEKDQKAFDKRVKTAFAIIATNLVDKEMAHIKHCRGPAEAWKTLCNIHETKSLSNILFLRRKFFTIKMQEADCMLDHINKVKSLADQLMCLEVPLKDEDIVMTLLDSLPSSYEHLITALETRPMKELTLEFITARLMHEVAKRKEKEPQGDDAAMVSRQGKGGSSKKREERTCFKCGKSGHIAKNCWSTKDVANNTRYNDAHDDFAFVAAHSVSSSQVSKWIVDSGATQHMTPNRQAFDTYETISSRNVFLGDNGMVEALGKGSILVESQVKGKVKKIRVYDVLHVPKLHANLLSVSKLVSRGLKVHFNKTGCIVWTQEGEMLAMASLEDNLYQMQLKKVNGAEVNTLAHTSDHNMELWHKRLGHLNVTSMKTLRNMVIGLDLGQCSSDVASFECEGCVEGKQTRQPFPKDGGTRATKPLELVHSDVCGPMKTLSIGGARYFLTFIDDFTRKVWVFPLKNKNEVLEKFKTWKTLVERQSEHKIKTFRSDNGGEFTSKAFDETLHRDGIERQTSAPYTPQQNGVAERANRTLVEMARAMIHAQGLTYEFWAEAVCNATYIRNRCPTKAVHNMTPEEAWSGKKPHVSHLRVFGCVAFAKVPDEKRSKLDAKAIKCLMLGYCEGTKAYRLICLDSKKIIKSPHVTFFEDKKALEECPSGRDIGPAFVVDESSKSDDGDTDDTVQEEKPVLSRSLEQPKAKEEITKLSGPAPTQHEEHHSSRYPTRVRRPPGEWWKNHILPQGNGDQHANVAISSEPKTLSAARRCSDASKWEQAVQEEYDSLIANGTWELAALPEDRSTVGCKWVFRTKKDASGNIVRYKARLVAKGYSQVEGVDFNETFAPVAKFSTIRCILALGAAMDLEIHQMDVKTAFLNGELEEDIFMDQPEGFVQEGNEHLVCKLKKSLYGLRQSPRAWYEKIHQFFAEEGFYRSHADHSLYIKQSSSFLLIVIIYVDDLIMLSSDLTVLQELKSRLEEEFDMSDIGELHFFLGVQMERNRATRTITLHQGNYIEEVLERFGMADCKPIGTPLDAKTQLVKLSEEEYEQHLPETQAIPYKEAVGSLMYAMVATRPDLAFAVSVVSQFMSKPGPLHWAAVKRIMRYLKGTLGMKLCLGGRDIDLKGYCDADWGGDQDTRRSTTGYVFFIGQGAISWNSKRQPTVALSTTEAEYMATTQSAKEAIWLRQLMADVGCVQDKATIIMSDNQGSIALAKNPKHHSRTKHIDVQHHFIREKVEMENIELRYCQTQYMVADVLTKALTKDRHETLRRVMGIVSFDTTQSGSVRDWSNEQSVLEISVVDDNTIGDSSNR